MSYTKMKPEHKARWIKALRSGKYGQTQEVLYGGHDEQGRDSYCCLGVLCTITPEVTMVEYHGERSYGLKPELSQYKPAEQTDDDSYGDPWEDHLVDGELNPEMMTFFGISAAAQKRLIQMNDDKGKNFNEIADWVEKNL